MGLLLNRNKLLSDHKLLGRWGERQAEKFLKKKGLVRLARNFFCKTGEIDLIMADTDGSIVFVEVKTRADENFTPIESAITTAKKNRLRRTAHYFIKLHNIEGRNFRFDFVMIVLGRTGREQIRYYQNTISP